MRRTLPILHFDGSAFSVVSGGTTAATLTAVWGSAPANVWAVGSVAGPLGGRILHYDGVRWTEMASGSNALYGLWGSAADDVYAVGGIAKSGSILNGN
ncbi:MAG TPA: hypothetical protein PLW65_00845 [Pseudomonadota bacterium]|nr:hypothetical protein [Pseudomonadota bacterium]